MIRRQPNNYPTKLPSEVIETIFRATHSKAICTWDRRVYLGGGNEILDGLTIYKRVAIARGVDSPITTATTYSKNNGAYSWSSACFRSAMISSTDSRPTERRTNP